MTPAQIRSICNQATLTNSYPMIAPEHILALVDGLESLQQRNVLDELDTVEQFYKRVCTQAELNIEKTGKIEGAHYAEMQLVVKAIRLAARELSNEVESLSARLPDDTTDCQSLALDYQAAIGRVAALQAEFEIVNRLLDERGRVMLAIPECPEHGSQCVPHALEWVEQVQRDNAALRGWIDGKITTGELEEVLKK